MTTGFKVVACLALLWLGGCEEETRSEVTRVHSMCAELTPEGTLEVDVALDVCLSSSCDEVVDSGCTLVEGSDGVLEVEAFVVVESKGETCTTDCGGASVSCTFESPAEQSYVVRAADGDVAVEFDVAADDRVCSPDEL